MNVSDLIVRLCELVREHGDLPIYLHDWEYGTELNFELQIRNGKHETWLTIVEKAEIVV